MLGPLNQSTGSSRRSNYVNESETEKAIASMAKSTILAPPERYQASENDRSKLARQNNSPIARRRQGQLKREKTLTGSIIATGSSILLPTKVEITAVEKTRVETDLNNALSSEGFKLWPLLLPMYVPSQPRVSQAERPGRARAMTADHNLLRRKEQLEASALYSTHLSPEAKNKKEEIARRWAKRQERDIKDRRRISGGWEDVEEMKTLRDLSAFKPTLIKGDGNYMFESKENEESDEEWADAGDESEVNT